MANVKEIKEYLEEFINKVEFSNGSLNVNSLKTEYLELIEKSKELPDGMDLFSINIVSRIMFDTIKADESGNVTSEIKNEFVEKALNELTNAPYAYTFLYEMPNGYDLDPKKLDIDGNIEIFIPDQDQANSYVVQNTTARYNILDALNGLTNGIIAGKTYFKIVSEGYYVDTKNSFLLSHYSPQRIYELYLSVHAVFKTYARSGISFDTSGIGRVFNKDLEQISELQPPIIGSGLKFRNNKDKINKIDTMFHKLLVPYTDKKLEFARVQICNSLYWYVQMLNTSDVNLKTTHLISAIDSLFPQRKNENGTSITPKAPEKSSGIADYVSNNENEYNSSLGQLEKLFKDRNDVVHGKLEIKGSTLDFMRTQRTSSTLISQCTGYYLKYISKRISRFFDQPDLVN